MKLFGRLGLMIIVIFALSVLSSPTVWAAGVVGGGSPGSCDDNKLAVALNFGGEVTFNCGTNPFTMPANTHVIQDNTTIFGDNLITLDGENLRQLFIVSNNVTLTLKDITLLDGEFSTGGCVNVDVKGTLVANHVTFSGCRDTSSDGGGAVYNQGTFDAFNSTFRDNEADNEGAAVFNLGKFNASFVVFQTNKASDDGGAIKNANDGVVVVTDSLFTGNTAQNGGGAIENTLTFPTTTGLLTLRRNLFVNNTAVNFGGAINNVTGSAIIENSSFETNKADQGGAIYAENTSSTDIRFSTFNGNRGDTGSGIYRHLAGGSVKLGYSILTGGRFENNTPGALQCDGPALNSIDYNIISDGTCVDGSKAHDRRNTAPNIGLLKDNGGFTETRVPNLGSPALSKVPAAQCPTRDQRYAARIGNCDIGAAESDGLFDSAFIPQLAK